MAPSERDPRTVQSEELLPPVEAPTAGFILQLFIIPAVIVAIIVMLWLMFCWMALGGMALNAPNSRNVQQYVAALKKNNEARWQAAMNLANALQDERNDGPDALKNDSKLANELAGILATEIESGSTKEEPVSLRIFLARALGEFRVPDGLPTLLKALSKDKSDEVKRASLEAIALLSDNVGRASPPGKLRDPALQADLLAASENSSDLVRSAAAYTLGVVGDDAYVDKLKSLLRDSYPDVRYNAATGLARRGDPAAIDALAEMLDPAQMAGIRIEKGLQANETEDARFRDYKRAMLLANGLRAARRLSDKNSTADLSSLESGVKKLVEARVEPDKIRAEALDTLAVLQKRPRARAPVAPEK